MTTPTPRDTLITALEAVDRAVEAALALAWAREPTGDARRAAARQTVSAYEAADRRADLLLGVIVADGGTRGLDDALGAAHLRATERLTGCYALRAGSDDAGADRACMVAEHAAECALARLARAQQVALTWIAQKQGRAA
jgi:hypothetical protein